MKRLSRVSRRDLLKLAISLPSGILLSNLLTGYAMDDPSRPNFMIVVLDALTARNMSLYGYPRATTPNMERLARRATVYHAHYAAGTFTTPGTASLLTGTYPWTHRAIGTAGLILRGLTDGNIFNLLGGQYQRNVFTQNIYADILLGQFEDALDVHFPLTSFSEFPEKYQMLFHRLCTYSPM